MSTQSRKVNRAWLDAHVNDPYVKRAQKEGYRARAAYKLLELDEALHLIRPGHAVVDLGSAPGAWSQYARRVLMQKGAAPGQLSGRIIALDILPMEPIEGVHFIQGDFLQEQTLTQLEEVLGDNRVDLVMSDMAPNLSGIAATDAARMAALVELAVDFASQHLKADGALVAKVFHGASYNALMALFRQHFRTVKAIKPGASRSKSAETYLVGKGLR